MGKCKNIYCKNETKNKNVYCSLTCRNIYVNKYVRDYTKNGKGRTNKIKDDYNGNPKFCKNPKCGKKLRFDKRFNEYCDSSCSAAYTNTIRSISKYTVSDAGRKAIAISNRVRSADNYDKYMLNPKKCKNCKTELTFKNRKRIYCSRECRTIYERRHMTEYQKYKRECQFKFSLNDYPTEFDFGLIETHGWYTAANRGNNLDGVSRDHMYSIREGFDNKVPSELISHPANCKLMIHRKNISKHKKSSITVDDLKQRVYLWDKKYNM